MFNIIVILIKWFVYTQDGPMSAEVLINSNLITMKDHSDDILVDQFSNTIC